MYPEQRDNSLQQSLFFVRWMGKNEPDEVIESLLCTRYQRILTRVEIVADTDALASLDVKASKAL